MDEGTRFEGLVKAKTDMTGFSRYDGKCQENAKLAWDTIQFRSTKGIPSAFLLAMDWDLIEELSGHQTGSYQRKPEEVYRDFQLACGTCQIDQWIPRNPLTMTGKGLTPGTDRRATTGMKITSWRMRDILNSWKKISSFKQMWRLKKTPGL